MSARPGTQTRARVDVVEDGVATSRADRLVTEEPMEIRLSAGGTTRRLAVTMRTPGNDFELAAGFLRSEGIVTRPDQIRRIAYCTDADIITEQRFNVVTVDLAFGALPELVRSRDFLANSSCGVCGKASLDDLELSGCEALPPGPRVNADVVYGLPDRLRSGQGVFDRTGGLHAAGLFDPDGTALALREDVGRHNAVDKLLGWSFLRDGKSPESALLMVSGRVGYEIMQKAIVGGVPIVCAVSAPSSLAVDLAARFHVTLVGFLRGRRFNVYSAPDRIALAPAADGGAQHPR